MYRAAYERMVADHREHQGTVEYLHLLKLAAELTPERLESGIQGRHCGCRKWWKADLGAQEIPALRVGAPEMRLEPELASYHALLDPGVEVAHGI